MSNVCELGSCTMLIGTLEHHHFVFVWMCSMFVFYVTNKCQTNLLDTNARTFMYDIHINTVITCRHMLIETRMFCFNIVGGWVEVPAVAALRNPIRNPDSRWFSKWTNTYTHSSQLTMVRKPQLAPPKERVNVVIVSSSTSHCSPTSASIEWFSCVYYVSMSFCINYHKCN